MDILEYIFKSILIPSLPAFLGAFSAFVFFLIGSKINRKIQNRTAIKKEHAYLERYFSEIYHGIQYNKGLLPIIVKDYQTGGINLMDLVLIPIREDISMKIKDPIFINRIERYITSLKRLNLSIGNINKWKGKISEEIINPSETAQKRAKNSLDNFISQAQEFQKVLDFHLDEVKEFTAENRLLLRKYRNWNYEWEKMDKECKERRKLIDSELETMDKEAPKNPIMKEYKEKLKKFGIN